MWVQLNLLWFRGKSSMTRNIILCQDWLSVCQEGRLSQQSSGAPSKDAVTDPPGICHFVRACTTGSPCRTPLLYVPMRRVYIYLLRLVSLCFPLTALHLFWCVLFSNQLSIKSLKGAPSMCCKWFRYKSRDTEEKSSQIMYGKSFVASCHHTLVNHVTLWKNSLLSLSCNAM